jgi:pyruvate,orthophosphate dikinase
MANMGIQVPHGVTIPTQACVDYYADGMTAPQRKALVSQVVGAAVSALAEMGGDGPHLYPHLYSVRSGARVSMPGMMDTILNVGLHEGTIGLWIEKIGGRAAWDSYRRLVQMYGSVVAGVPAERFEENLRAVAGGRSESELTEDDFRTITTDNLETYATVTGKAFPQDTLGQMAGATEAVFRSWNNDRAKHYRSMYGYSDEWGTAVNIQAMVFGNTGSNSCSGVMFTRNPATGEKGVIGEYLVNAQGEDVVAGIRTPQNIKEMTETAWHGVWEDLMATALNLEAHCGDMQDIEFTVQDGEVFILQTRNAKRTPKAAFRVAHDQWKDGVWSTSEMLDRVPVSEFYRMQSPTVGTDVDPSGCGLAGGGFPVKGCAVFSSEDAVKMAGPTILIASETTPDDITGMEASVGILTQTGGMTSHAAVVARGMNKPCVVGLTDMVIDVEAQSANINGHVVCEGDEVVIDGHTGKVWFEELPQIDSNGLDPYTLGVMRELMKDAVVATSDPQDGIFGTVVIPVAVATREEIAELVASAPSVILDFTPKTHLFALRTGVQIDQMASMFGASRVDTETLRMQDKVAGIDFTKVAVTGTDHDTGLAQWLEMAGAQVPVYATTLHQVMKATGPVTLSPTLVNIMGGKKAKAKVLAALDAHEAGAVDSMSPAQALSQMAF